MGLVLYGVIILDLIGFLLCFYFVFRHKRKAKAIKHYEEVRDKLTFREAEKEVVSEAIKETCSSGILANLVGGFIIILVGISVMGAVTEQVESAKELQIDVSTPFQQQFMDSVPLFYMLGILTAGLALAIQGLRAAGIMGGGLMGV